jgi:hypothetical protein
VSKLIIRCRVTYDLSISQPPFVAFPNRYSALDPFKGMKPELACRRAANTDHKSKIHTGCIKRPRVLDAPKPARLLTFRPAGDS